MGGKIGSTPSPSISVSIFSLGAIEVENLAILASGWWDVHGTQRVLNDLWRNRLSRWRMTWLRPPPPPSLPSASCLSFSVFLNPVCRRWSRRQTMVLYKSFNTLFRDPLQRQQKQLGFLYFFLFHGLERLQCVIHNKPLVLHVHTVFRNTSVHYVGG